MPQENLIRMFCEECKRTNYWSRKNKRKDENKINLKKHCKWCGRHTAHKEAKKK